MNQVVPYALWLGHMGTARNFRQLNEAGIRALVQLAAEEPPPQPPRELICCHFPLLDGPGNNAELLTLAITTLTTLLRRHVPTLVSCSAGVSRGPAVAAAALALILNQPPEDCLRRVVAHHPSDVSPALWNDITELLPSLR